MTALSLGRESWQGVIERLLQASEPIAWSWAATRSGSGDLSVIALSIRAFTEVEAQHLEASSGLLLHSDSLSAREAGSRLQEGQLGYKDAISGLDLHVPVPGLPVPDMQPVWLTTETEFSPVGRAEWPTYYVWWPLSVSTGIDVYQPFIARNHFYPSSVAAITEVLYGAVGATFSQQAIIHLPDPRARLTPPQFLDSEMVCRVEEGLVGSAAGYSLEVVWKPTQGSTHLERSRRTVKKARSISFSIGGEPAEFSVALLSDANELADVRYWRPEPTKEQSPASPSDLAEALDYLDVVWRLAFNHSLVRLRRAVQVTRLAEGCSTRVEFESRISDLADVLKALEIPDQMLARSEVDGTATLHRIRVFLGRRIPLDKSGVDAAVATLQAINDVRRAIQHVGASDELPAALNKLGIQYPPNWSEAWPVVRTKAVGALAAIREVVQNYAYVADATKDVGPAPL